ncbi:KCNMB3 [Branchiostoma lanceolatum]|uniref:KCNMB3 protein n=1 Tax=Branchiostoma lanceolatum TaxID=7740 RepID=A0A8J9Z2Z6_BRALA|nr:KCNMB3 [Branchiostoma lanceolatum]
MSGSKCYCMAASMMVVLRFGAFVLLVIFIINDVKPAIRGLYMRRTMCTVLTSSFSSDTVSCECPGEMRRGCRSSFPCLKINVTFVGRHRQNLTGVLVDNQKNMGYRGDQLCSTRPCNKYRYHNVNRVEDFQRSVGQTGQTFPCYFDPGDQAEVFRQVLDANVWAIFHYLFWPSFAMVFSCGCGCFLLGKVDFEEIQTMDQRFR